MGKQIPAQPVPGTARPTTAVTWNASSRPLWNRVALHHRRRQQLLWANDGAWLERCWLMPKET